MNKELTYELQRAYRETSTQGEAIERVKDKYPDADLNILWWMWLAIDAYKDMSE